MAKALRRGECSGSVNPGGIELAVRATESRGSRTAVNRLRIRRLGFDSLRACWKSAGQAYFAKRLVTVTLLFSRADQARGCVQGRQRRVVRQGQCRARPADRPAHADHTARIYHRGTVGHFRRLVAEKRVPCYKVGRLVRFDPAEITGWLATCRVPGARTT